MMTSELIYYLLDIGTTGERNSGLIIAILLLIIAIVLILLRIMNSKRDIEDDDSIGTESTSKDENLDPLSSNSDENNGETLESLHDELNVDNEEDDNY